MMDTVAIVDTSICTDNLGDEIIMDAVNSVVWDLFPNAYVLRVPSHESLSDRTRKFVRQADWCFIGGTNLLSSKITALGLWRLDRLAAAAYGSTRTVCLGTGWNKYMSEATPGTRALLRTALSPELTHAVRDSYTTSHLEKVGLKAVTTSCMTTWSLTPEHCSTIPAKRASSVVFTLSAWHPDAAADRAFVEVLRRRYKRVTFFSQMQNDYDYFRQFGWDDISVAAVTTEAYNHFLENEDVDFVGTRLHGGIRAMQKGRRALILAIDNRATELGKDTGLPVLQRTDTAGIEAWLDREEPIRPKLPEAAINSWKAQFRGEAAAAVPKPAPIAEPSLPRHLSRLKRAVSRVYSPA
ncbi:MAG: polysaccharide pyruvyl transferase family protein [Inquilinus limosus]|uniref:Polysaccharide pyruvyl transferase family protein n=1 Tax=Inquilinus limosus TaxID=171674 RepID=A0A952FN00_9PROT|nr:polysaccharide pyruvyl transferase family protein [Inquilinus limosus]